MLLPDMLEVHFILVGLRPGKAGPMYVWVTAYWTMNKAVRGTYTAVGLRPGIDMKRLTRQVR
jgi:hypothetical protein